MPYHFGLGFSVNSSQMMVSGICSGFFNAIYWDTDHSARVSISTFSSSNYELSINSRFFKGLRIKCSAPNQLCEIITNNFILGTESFGPNLDTWIIWAKNASKWALDIGQSVELCLVSRTEDVFDANRGREKGLCEWNESNWECKARYKDANFLENYIAAASLGIHKCSRHTVSKVSDRGFKVHSHWRFCKVKAKGFYCFAHPLASVRGLNP